jgi:hypothetical protein
MASTSSTKRRREEGTSASDVARRGLVSLNQLDYVLQPDLSVATSRNMKRHYFQQTEYTPGQDAIAILNSGADYIDPQNSYLAFTVENTAPLTSMLALGSGSAANFIQRVVLTSRSGDELERVDDVNKLAVIMARYTRSESWLKTVGSMSGYGDKYDAEAGSVGVTSAVGRSDVNGVLIGAGREKRSFAIPLGELFGLFRSFDRLLPSMLCSGLRFEIHFADVNRVGYNVINAAPGADAATLAWKISDISIMADSYQLTDSIQRVLNEEASIKGLELVFSSWHHHTESPANASGASVNMELRKAVSRALGVLYKVGIKDLTGGPGIDPFACKKRIDGQDFQLRLGSLYFPQQVISKSSELYHHTMRGWGKLKTPSAPGDVGFSDYELNSAVVYTDLERSTTQKLTGVPVNNSRIVEIRATDNFTVGTASDGDPNYIAKRYKDSLVSAHRLDVWLHYVRLARVFLQNVQMED